MTFKEFSEERKRMCATYFVHGNEGECPFHDHAQCCAACNAWCLGEPERAEAHLTDWIRLHPRRTYLTVLSEKFSHYKEDGITGSPVFCPHDIDVRYEDRACVYDKEGNVDCVACWNRPAPELEEE